MGEPVADTMSVVVGLAARSTQPTRTALSNGAVPVLYTGAVLSVWPPSRRVVALAIGIIERT